MEHFVNNAYFYGSFIPLSGIEKEDLKVWHNEILHQDFEKIVNYFRKIGNISFNLEIGQSLITKDFNGFCDSTNLEQAIQYRKEIGHHVEIYPIKEFIF